MRVFYEPLALTAFETNDVACALESLQHIKGLRWHRAPSGTKPDVYLSHLRSIDLQEEVPDSSHHMEQDGQQYGQTSNQHQQRVLLDANGKYRNRPVCLLGEDEDDHFVWHFDGQPEKALALHQLLTETAGDTLNAARIQFALMQHLIRMRDIWGKKQLLWTNCSAPHYLAVATVRKRTMWWHPELTPHQLEQAEVLCVPYEEKTNFDSAAYQSISMWQALWNHVQRTHASPMHAALSERNLHRLIQLHHSPHLPERGVGYAAQFIMRRLKKAPESVYTLSQQSIFASDELLRALVGLLLTRVITMDNTANTANTD